MPSVCCGLEVSEGDAPSSTLEQCLVAIVPIQVQLGGELGLIEHDDIRSLLSDEPVKVPLLLLSIDASHIPYQGCQLDIGNV